MIQVQTSQNPTRHKPPKTSIRIPSGFTLIEVGIILIIVLGPFLGAIKRYAPVPDSIITLPYDFLCFGLLVYVIFKRLLHLSRLPYSRLTLPIVIFAGYALIAVLFPTVSSFGRGILGWRFLVSGMFLHFLGFYAFDDVRRIWRVMKVFWLTGGVVAIYGLVQLLRGYTIVELQWIQQLAATMVISGTGRYRLMSTMGSAVDLGFFLALTSVTLLTALMLKWWGKWKWWGIFSIMVFALVFTYVRAAWIAVFVAAVYITLVYLWCIKQLRVLYPILIVVFFLLIGLLTLTMGTVATTFNNQALQERVGSLTNPLQDKSMQDRFKRWDEIGEIIADYPMGIGVGMTGAASMRFSNESSLAPITMDNSYLKVTVEMGILGFVLFLWVILSLFWHARKITHIVIGEYYILAIMFIASFIAFMILMFLGEYIELNPSRSIIWLFTGFLFSLTRLQTNTSTFK